MARANTIQSWGLSQFVVDASAPQGNYATIQDAINATGGSSAVIYVRGNGLTYTEDLSFSGDIQLIGVSADGRIPQVVLSGTHTFADGITVAISNIFMSANGNPSIFTLNPVAGVTALAMKNCDLLNNTGSIITSNPTVAASCVMLIESCQVNSSSDAFVSTGLGSGTTWNLKFGDYEASGTGRFFSLSGFDRVFADSLTGTFGGEAFLMNGGNEDIRCNFCQITSSLFTFSGPLGGKVKASNSSFMCNDPSGFFITGAPDFDYSDISLPGSAKDINLTVGNFPVDWKPYATAGTSGSAIRGTAGFDNADFTSTSGFVEIAFSTTGAVTQINGQTGSATPSSGIISFDGGPGVTVDASGSTVTVASVNFINAAVSAIVGTDSGTWANAAITLTTPNGALDGEMLIFVATTVAAVVVQAQGTDLIRIENQISSAGGTATSTAIGDSLTLRFRAADTTWYAVGVTGTWTLA